MLRGKQMSATELYSVTSAHRVGDVPGPDEPLLDSIFAPGRMPVTRIVRTRLVNHLNRSVRNKPLTLICAPAGAGKSMLAASWVDAKTVPWPIAWLTVDDACDRAELFWPCLIEALERAGVSLPQVRRLSLGDATSTSFFARLAADILRLPQPVVLVLDGADCSLDSETTAGLDFLIRHAHPGLRLMICGRADPQLPLHRYRLTESMTELRLDALAFTPAETQTLLTSLGLTVSNQIATSLTELTEGWAAGLRLAAASLQQGTDPDELVDSLACEDGNVAEYLFAEVLQAQRPQIREFLLRTSVIEQLWPDLVDRLTDRADGRRTLAALVHANVFVGRSAHPAGTYRVHPLFRALLSAQLQFESPDDVSELHLRCARWFAEAGHCVSAVEHAISGGDWEYAASQLVETFAVGSLIAQDRSPYAAVTRSLADHLSGGSASLLRAAWDLSCGVQVSEPDADEVARLAADEDGPITLQVSAAVVHVAIAAGRKTDCAEALEAADHAEALLSQMWRSQQVRAAELSAILRVSRATTLMMNAGDRDASADALRAALTACDVARSRRLKGAAMGALALLEASHGNLRRAEELARAAEGLANDCGLAGDRRSAAAALAMAWVNCEQFHHVEARRWVSRVHERPRGADDRLVQPLLAVVQARLLRSRHDLNAAERVLEPFVNEGESPRWALERVLLEQAEIQLVRGRPERATAIVDALVDPHVSRAEPVRDRATSLGARSSCSPRDVADDAELPVDVLVAARIARACRYVDKDEVSRAVSDARRALESAEPEAMRRPFIDSTLVLRRLLRLDLSLGAAAAWLNPSLSTVAKPARAAVRQASSGSASAPRLAEIEPLTDREIEVLRLLSELLSTEEIAAAIFVSVNTVRTHIRSILRKLAVSRRTEAVRRARELSVL